MQIRVRKMKGDSVKRLEASSWRGSQVVRHGSAKAVFVGSIPTLASNVFKLETDHETDGDILGGCCIESRNWKKKVGIIR